ncbi:hypothetical protein ACC734_19065 [Rhizobium ruizarguesonis]|uniref:hypothetical protein n=1 Tax=Rhizobium ruizarguesonis TaxID=2081791 RepID=UPI001FE1BD4C|nr:hypothetical protein [Rhizobium ruizarguesonis]
MFQIRAPTPIKIFKLPNLSRFGGKKVDVGPGESAGDMGRMVITILGMVADMS